jgi:hypothetical protein
MVTLSFFLLPGQWSLLIWVRDFNAQLWMGQLASSTTSKPGFSIIGPTAFPNALMGIRSSIYASGLTSAFRLVEY